MKGGRYSEEQREFVREGLKVLSFIERRIIRLMYWDDIPAGGIARRLGKNISAIRAIERGASRG